MDYRIMAPKEYKDASKETRSAFLFDLLERFNVIWAEQYAGIDPDDEGDGTYHAALEEMREAILNVLTSPLTQGKERDDLGAYIEDVGGICVYEGIWRDTIHVFVYLLFHNNPLNNWGETMINLNHLRLFVKEN